MLNLPPFPPMGGRLSDQLKVMNRIAKCRRAQCASGGKTLRYLNLLGGDCSLGDVAV